MPTLLLNSYVRISNDREIVDEVKMVLSDTIKIVTHAISRHQLRYLYDDKIDIAYIGAVPPWTE